MQITHQFDNEYERLLDLETYQIMDSDSEAGFDLLTSLASAICNTPIAFISFIDSTRQWFKSSVGIDIEEIPRSLTACNETIEKEDHFIVTGQEVEWDTPYAKTMKKLGLSFYAGVPVKSSAGLNIGTLCVMDYISRQFKNNEIQKLKLISKQVTKLLEVRNKYLENMKMISELQEEKSLLNKHFEDLVHRVSRKSMAELSLGISHRLQENLITIENVSENISKDQNISDMSRRELTVLNQGLAGIRSMLGQLNQYVQSLKTDEKIKFSVQNVVHKVLNHLKYEFEEQDITCNVIHEESLITFGNQSHFLKAFYSIVRNSIEAVGDLADKKIEISLRRNGNKGELDIMDSGLGIADSVRPFLFQPLFTTKNKVNTGIGLSLGQSLLEKQDACITLIKTSNPTTFRITFDILEDHAADAKS